ncbi:2-C-methyl-D-erythritol 2,4-cyclodiphosphate synthase [Fervidobacterium thailandense]|uniref:2-C-methyl-D-erythritol 2,4-cyclodiphosphate synthase n=1 Tax=Fervidobacterium thailandense TaxID=1008305 RepID=UPI000845DD68|nr:2-C-methyl-D-erythritol 2,4-cyclodiphosphate synthase [Fervidobacterium thailandense]
MKIKKLSNEYVDEVAKLVYLEKQDFYDDLFGTDALKYIVKALNNDIPPFLKDHSLVALENEKVVGTLLFADKASFRHGYQKWLKVLGLKIFPVGSKMIYIIQRLLLEFGVDDLYIVALSGSVREYLLHAFIKQNRYRKVIVDTTDEAFYAKFGFHEGTPVHNKLKRFEKLCDYETLSGIGWDTHPLVSGRELVLGGVKIESQVGLDGHSDADVLCHAIIDSLLGVSLKTDIGQIFPETAENRNRNSLEMLKEVVQKLNIDGYFPSSIDCVIISPIKLSVYRERMTEKIASVTNCPVSIKFKSGNGVYPESEFKGITAICISNVEKI